MMQHIPLVKQLDGNYIVAGESSSNNDQVTGSHGGFDFGL